MLSDLLGRSGECLGGHGIGGTARAIDSYLKVERTRVNRWCHDTKIVRPMRVVASYALQAEAEAGATNTPTSNLTLHSKGARLTFEVSEREVNIPRIATLIGQIRGVNRANGRRWCSTLRLGLMVAGRDDLHCRWNHACSYDSKRADCSQSSALSHSLWILSDSPQVSVI